MTIFAAGQMAGQTLQLSKPIEGGWEPEDMAGLSSARHAEERALRRCHDKYPSYSGRRFFFALKCAHLRYRINHSLPTGDNDLLKAHVNIASLLVHQRCSEMFNVASYLSIVTNSTSTMTRDSRGHSSVPVYSLENNPLTRPSFHDTLRRR